MALRLATSAALVGTVAGTINLAITDCGDSSTRGHVTSISPSSIEQGKTVVVSGAGHLDTTVADGSFDINVNAGQEVTSCRGDICRSSKCNLPGRIGSVNFHGVACPLAPGNVSLDFDVSFSKFAQDSFAHLDIEMSAQGSAGKLLCATLSASPGGTAVALDVIVGLSRGFFDDQTLPQCIEHVAQTVPAVKSALEEVVAALKSKNAFKIAKAIKNLLQELKNVPEELQACGANIQDVEDLLNELEEKIPAIIGEIVAARASLDQGNYEDFGEHTGKSLSLLIGHDAPNSTQAANRNPSLRVDGNAAFDFIVGLSDGLFNDHTFSECIANVMQTIPEFKSALADLVSALKSKNPFKITKAIKELKDLITNLPDSLKVCSDNYQEVQDLLSELRVISTSEIHDIEEALDSLKYHRYELFGEWTGKALRMVVYGDQPRVTSIVV